MKLRRKTRWIILGLVVIFVAVLLFSFGLDDRQNLPQIGWNDAQIFKYLAVQQMEEHLSKKKIPPFKETSLANKPHGDGEIAVSIYTKFCLRRGHPIATRYVDISFSSISNEFLFNSPRAISPAEWKNFKHVVTKVEPTYWKWNWDF